jgi:hypothetical protein
MLDDDHRRFRGRREQPSHLARRVGVQRIVPRQLLALERLEAAEHPGRPRWCAAFELPPLSSLPINKRIDPVSNQPLADPPESAHGSALTAGARSVQASASSTWWRTSCLPPRRCSAITSARTCPSRRRGAISRRGRQAGAHRPPTGGRGGPSKPGRDGSNHAGRAGLGRRC